MIIYVDHINATAIKLLIYFETICPGFLFCCLIYIDPDYVVILCLF